MSVTFNVVNGRRQVHARGSSPSREISPRPARRYTSRERSPRSRRHTSRESSPRPSRRYTSRESSPKPSRRSSRSRESSPRSRRYSSRESSPRSRRYSSRESSPRPYMAVTPLPRLQIMIPNDHHNPSPSRNSRSSKSENERNVALPPVAPSDDVRPSIVLMSKKFQDDPTAASARPQLESKKYRLLTEGEAEPAPSSVKEQRVAKNGAVTGRRPDSEPVIEPKPIVSSRSRFRALEAYPELFGNGSHPGVLLVQNLPLDVTGQEIVMKVFPEHDILAADLYESDDREPFAEILFPRAQDAVAALQRHLGQIYRGRSLKVTLLNAYKI